MILPAKLYVRQVMPRLWGLVARLQANRPDTDITLGVDSLWAAIDNFARSY